jgi:hypothetical protein
MMNILKSCLNGSYSFTQTSKNSKNGNIFSTGISVFEPISTEKVRHTKKGSYILNGQEQEFFQVRYFVFKQGRVIMEKYEESLLHEFMIPDNDPSFPMTLHHSHHCNDDIYNITLKILSPDEFQTEYRIKGQKKNEIIQSQYTRIHQ